MMEVTSSEIPTKPYDDQKPGTSGLRKKVAKFVDNQYYLENFVQSTLDAYKSNLKLDGTKDPIIESLVIGGDGRYLNDESILKIVNICAANKVRKIYVARDGVMSTPSGSFIIRELKLSGGFILSASHNPGGPSGDFGIKFNNHLGAPAAEDLTNKIYELTKTIKSFKLITEPINVKLSDREKVSLTVDGIPVSIEHIDAVAAYGSMAMSLFDFGKIGLLLKSFSLVVDSMHAVMAHYVDAILVKQLGMPGRSHLHSDALEDFGGLHPDPNLVYAQSLVTTMIYDDEIHFGVAFDGDGDRNMILGRGGFFVAPSDSLAVIAANYKHIRKAFGRSGGELLGVARSMPTAPAVDRFAKKHNLNVYETPTGWKFFCNLFEANKISICGEESFGLGASHIREKDGMWAALAWLAIIAERNMSVKDLVTEYWKEYGRDYFSRYDYESVDSSEAKKVVEQLDRVITSGELIGRKFSDRLVVKYADNFEYTDPVTRSVTSKQGYRIVMENGARIVVRLSGTGSSGETIRFYFNDYSKTDLFNQPYAFLQVLIEVGMELSKIHQLTSRKRPSVIT